ncbi:raffinose/stachyose/melibiose transport system permease protein [Microbacterium sp. SLBN-154]|uniref:carbohydrate ABC transporter permease n=1 Tax=Microbacterium sp. SLBN-154 TaxID=2768458 RepID=UPI001152A21E|nr:carbohydrate ABC transporter permease [Microbacterium sp. SLBN-154]TQK18669.1 raffinose/stachyose/melibiose transport system permease protein [Microbacterium sp. SLBN-154]
MSSRLARRTGIAGGIRYLLLALFAVPWVLVPLWLLVVNSFKTERAAADLTLGLPEEWRLLENYAAVFADGNYLTGLRNSLLVAIPTIAAVLILGAMAAWAYARSRSMTLQSLYYLSALSILLPPAVIPTIFVLTTLGIDGSLAGYALMMIGTKMGLFVFLATGFVKGIPMEIEESAAIDGASRVRTFFQILLPLLRPVMFVGAVLLIIAVWNDLFFAQLLLRGPDNATLPVALFSFASASMNIIRWNEVFAHVVLSSLPLVIVYIIAQRQVLAGLTEGGVKG